MNIGVIYNVVIDKTIVYVINGNICAEENNQHFSFFDRGSYKKDVGAEPFLQLLSPLGNICFQYRGYSSLVQLMTIHEIPL